MMLIEILLSVAILAAGIVVIMQALARGAYALTFAENQLRAYTFARSKLVDLDMSFRRGVEPVDHGEFRIGHEQFRWGLMAAPLEEPRLQVVTLTVAWRQGQREEAARFNLVAPAPKDAEAAL